MLECKLPLVKSWIWCEILNCLDSFKYFLNETFVSLKCSFENVRRVLEKLQTILRILLGKTMDIFRTFINNSSPLCRLNDIKQKTDQHRMHSLIILTTLVNFLSGDLVAPPPPSDEDNDVIDAAASNGENLDNQITISDVTNKIILSW